MSERIGAHSFLQLTTVAWILVALAIPIRDALIIPALAGLVFLTWTDNGILARWLSARPLQSLGKLSYSVYLMHIPVNVAISFVWVRIEHRLHLNEAVSRTLFLCLMFAAVLAVARFTYAYVEKPWRERLRHRRAVSQIAAVAAP